MADAARAVCAVEHGWIAGTGVAYAEEYHDMTTHTRAPHRYPFVIGLLAGTVVGAGLVAWLAPRAASEARKRLTDSLQRLGDRVGDRYQQAATRVTQAAGRAAKTGQPMGDGAHEVERGSVGSRIDPQGRTS
jgi:hypothetical protein